jgi:hypothetical protein
VSLRAASCVEVGIGNPSEYCFTLDPVQADFARASQKRVLYLLARVLLGPRGNSCLVSAVLSWKNGVSSSPGSTPKLACELEYQSLTECCNSSMRFWRWQKHLLLIQIVRGLFWTNHSVKVRAGFWYSIRSEMDVHQRF